MTPAIAESVEQRRQEITAFLAEQDATDRIAAARARADRLEAALAADVGPEIASKAMEARQECRRRLWLAMACCGRVAVTDGVVKCYGADADKHTRALAPFNHVPPGLSRSLAALLLARMTEDQ
ncbi:hypothetical protein [Roseiconus nitratireducens]|nr:hypothetical protein [Roseiconus nitratireducens]